MVIVMAGLSAPSAAASLGKPEGASQAQHSAKLMVIILCACVRVCVCVCVCACTHMCMLVYASVYIAHA